MATKPRKDDQGIEEAKRIMERLVKTPHKPHTHGRKETEPHGPANKQQERKKSD